MYHIASQKQFLTYDKKKKEHRNIQICKVFDKVTCKLGWERWAHVVLLRFKRGSSHCFFSLASAHGKLFPFKACVKEKTSTPPARTLHELTWNCVSVHHLPRDIQANCSLISSILSPLLSTPTVLLDIWQTPSYISQHPCLLFHWPSKAC